MRYALHEHQSRALAMLRASLLAGARRPMVMAPTGFGKTLLAAAIVDGALAKGKRVLFVAPFLSLIDQTVEAFAVQDIRSVGVMQGYHPLTDGSQPVQVCSMQTLQRRRLPKADLVIVDEAHRWFEFLGEWMAMPEWANVPFIGLSATPWTKGLGKHYDDLIIAATTAELIKTVNPTTGQTYLSPYKVFAPSHPDLSKVRTVAGDYHEGQLADVMSQPKLVGDVVATWLTLGEGRPTLCFAVDRAHARKLADAFEAAGVPCGYVDANTERAERELIGRRLANGQISVVCNVGCLTTGIDWDVRCIVLARPTKSEALFVQIVGRGLRPANGKDHLVLLDHSDTTLRLGFPSDIHRTTLDMGTHQKSQGTKETRPEALPKECLKCHHLKPAGVRKCSECGFEPERQSQIEELEGSLVQLNGKRRKKEEATPHDKQTFWSMCLYDAAATAKGDPHKLALARYKKRFGVWPRGLRDAPRPPDEAFARWAAADRRQYQAIQSAIKKRSRQSMSMGGDLHAA